MYTYVIALSFTCALFAAQVPIRDTDFPFLLNVLSTVAKHEDFKAKKEMKQNQYIRYQICCLVYAKRAVLFPKLGTKELELAQTYLASQTPPSPTAQQLQLVPLKYLNAFGHVLDHLRPYFELDAEIAKKYAQLIDKNPKVVEEFIPSSGHGALLDPKFAQSHLNGQAKKETSQNSKANGSTHSQISKKQEDAVPLMHPIARKIRTRSQRESEPTVYDQWTSALADSIVNHFK